LTSQQESDDDGDDDDVCECEFAGREEALVLVYFVDSREKATHCARQWQRKKEEDKLSLLEPRFENTAVIARRFDFSPFTIVKIFFLDHFIIDGYFQGSR